MRKQISKKEINLLRKISKGATIYRSFRWKTDHLILKDWPYVEYINRDMANWLSYHGYLTLDNLFITEKGWKLLDKINNEKTNT